MRNLLIIASGPSVELINPELFKDFDTLTINRPWDKIPNTTYWVYNDDSIVQQQYKKLMNYGGLIITNNRTTDVPFKNVWRCKVIQGFGWSEDYGTYYLSRTSTYGALQTAIQLNYDNVIIIGIDQKFDDNQYHSGHTAIIPNERRKARFDDEIRAFNFIPDNRKHQFHFVSDRNTNKWFLCNNHTSPDKLEEYIKTNILHGQPNK